jgi:hypothetical protein
MSATALSTRAVINLALTNRLRARVGRFII